MRFAPFSKKQLRVLTWWRPGSPDRQKDAILCDGAVRSGKTLCLSLSFVMWATHCFSGQDFALCGKTHSLPPAQPAGAPPPHFAGDGVPVPVCRRAAGAYGGVGPARKPVLPLRRAG